MARLRAKLSGRQSSLCTSIDSVVGGATASGASRCSAPQPGTVYLLRYEPPNSRWAPSSACWRLSFSSMREPLSGAVVTEQRVRRRIQISGLNSTQTSTYSAACHFHCPSDTVRYQPVCWSRANSRTPPPVPLATSTAHQIQYVTSQRVEAGLTAEPHLQCS